MVDIQSAKIAFADYVANYNPSNMKIKLKIEHTYRVLEVSGLIAKNIGLSQEDTELAMLIGLLHDIGRFEQIKIYNTFSDVDSIDHAKFGAKLLFEDNLIRKFIKDTKYDNIIKQAILNHNKYEIAENLSEREMLYSKIIRDADKIDIFHLTIDESFDVLYDCSDISEELISDNILDDFVNHRLVLNKNAKTNLDKWIKNLSWVFDLNFDYSYKLIKEKDYINILINRIDYKKKDTINKVNIIRKITEDFLNSKN